MTKQVLKSIATGLFLGAAFFLMPFFILKLVAFFIIIGSLFKFFAWRMFSRFFSQWQGRPFADNIRKDYNQQYEGFNQNYRHRNPHGEKKVIIIN